MALATAMHHSSGKVHTVDGAPRGQTSATRAGEEGHEEYYNAPRRQKPPPHQAFFQLYDEEDAVWGTRPASLTEPPGPQERVQQRAVEQIDDFAPMVQILEVPVLPVVLGWVQDRILQRIVEQAFTDDKKQEIAGPKISSPDRLPPRAVVSASQVVEQQWKCRWCPRWIALSMFLCRLWKCQMSCFTQSFSSILSSRKLTVLFVGMLDMVQQRFVEQFLLFVIKVVLQDGDQQRSVRRIHEDFQGLVPGQNSSAFCGGPQGTVFNSVWWSSSSRFCPSTSRLS